MKVKNQNSLKFTGIQFIGVNFKSVRPSGADTDVTLNITPKVFFPKGKPRQFVIIINVRIKEAEEAFSLEVKALGTFQTQKNITKANRNQFVNVNAPAIIFPYIRAFISTLTANLGEHFQPMLLPTQFFRGDIEVIHNLED